MSFPPARSSGKRALVTGSSRGIGADTARYLAAAGADVVINYRNKAPRAEKLVAAIEEPGGEALAVGADLTDPESVAGDVRRRCERAFGRPRHPRAQCLRRHGVRDGRGLRAAAQPRRAGQRARGGAAAARRRVAASCSSRATRRTSSARRPTMPEYEPVALQQARRRGRAARADPGARRERASGSSSSRAT